MIKDFWGIGAGTLPRMRHKGMIAPEFARVKDTINLSQRKIISLENVIPARAITYHRPVLNKEHSDHHKWKKTDAEKFAVS